MCLFKMRTQEMSVVITLCLLEMSHDFYKLVILIFICFDSSLKRLKIKTDKEKNALRKAE